MLVAPVTPLMVGSAFTVMVKVLEVTGEVPEGFPADGVMTTLTTSPFANVVVVYVALEVPTGVVFTYHW